jgi:hypothetical protein
MRSAIPVLDLSIVAGMGVRTGHHQSLPQPHTAQISQERIGFNTRFGDQQIVGAARKEPGF